MNKKFEDFSARVLVVEPAATVRGMIADVVKALGFASVQSMDSLKSAAGYLEVEAADWILAPMLASEQVNALNFMRALNEHEKFRDTFVTLIVDEKEVEHLPRAFELGLMSWHSKTGLSKDGLARELRDLLDTLKAQNGNVSYVAFDYLQIFLRSKGRADLLMQASKELVSLHPTSQYAVFNLARNQFALGKRAEGLRTLGHARASDLPGWDKVAKELLQPGEEVELKLPLKKVLVVEPDKAAHKQIDDILRKYADELELRFEVDGLAAMQWAKNNSDLDLVIQEWRIPTLTGHVFLQRLRKAQKRLVPVIVLSPLLRRDDAPILSEMGVCKSLEKPTDEKTLVKAIFGALLEHSSPTEPVWIERKIGEKLAYKDQTTVQQLYRRLSEHPQCTDDQRFYVQALRLYDAGEFEAAKTLCAKAIQLGGDQMKTLTLLGRCLTNLRDFRSAIKCFERAQQLSPKNIERLCELAEAQSEADQADASAQSLDAAKAMDAQSEVVVGAETKIEIAKGNVDKARELMAYLGSMDQLVSDLNSSAVAWVRTGRFEKGVELYNRTLEALPAEDHVTQARVLYNLALAYVRKGDLSSAQGTLARAKMTIDHPVRAKLLSLKRRVEQSLASKASLSLTSSQSASASQGPDSSPWQMNVTSTQVASATAMIVQDSQTGPLRTTVFNRGIMGLVGLPEGEKSISAGLLRFRVSINLRAAIARPESMGAEKAFRSAG